MILDIRSVAASPLEIPIVPLAIWIKFEYLSPAKKRLQFTNLNHQVSSSPDDAMKNATRNKDRLVDFLRQLIVELKLPIVGLQRFDPAVFFVPMPLKFRLID